MNPEEHFLRGLQILLALITLLGIIRLLDKDK